MIIEGSGSGSTAASGSGSAALTSGSGSGSRRPKNTWIRWIRIRIRIRIRNTDSNFRLYWRKSNFYDRWCLGEKLSVSVARCYPMKNRAPDILPFDQTRVQLKSSKVGSWIDDFFSGTVSWDRLKKYWKKCTELGLTKGTRLIKKIFRDSEGFIIQKVYRIYCG